MSYNICLDMKPHWAFQEDVKYAATHEWGDVKEVPTYSKFCGPTRLAIECKTCGQRAFLCEGYVNLYVMDQTTCKEHIIKSVLE